MLTNFFGWGGAFFKQALSCCFALYCAANCSTALFFVAWTFFSILVAVVSLIKKHYRTILKALQLWILSWPIANLSDRFQFMVFCHVCFEPRLLIRPVWTCCGFANVCTDGPSRKNFLLQSGDEHCQFFLFNVFFEPAPPWMFCSTLVFNHGHTSRGQKSAFFNSTELVEVVVLCNWCVKTFTGLGVCYPAHAASNTPGHPKNGWKAAKRKARKI